MSPTTVLTYTSHCATITADPRYRISEVPRPLVCSGGAKPAAMLSISAKAKE